MAPASMIIVCALTGISGSLGAIVLLLASRREVVVRSRSPYLIVRRQRAMEKWSSRWVVLTVDRLAHLVNRLACGLRLAGLERAYARAGSPGGYLPDELVTCGLVLGAGFAGLAVVLLAFVGAVGFIPFTPLIALSGPLLFWFALAGAGKERQTRIWRSLPYVYDLLVMVLSSGIGVSEAIQQVGHYYEHEPVGEELGLVISEVQLGVTRRQALENMAARVNLPELTQFVEAVIHAEEFGMKVAEAVKRMSEQARTKRWQASETKANKASVFVAFPTTLILIGNLMLLLGPFVLRIMQMMGEI